MIQSVLTYAIMFKESIVHIRIASMMHCIHEARVSFLIHCPFRLLQPSPGENKKKNIAIRGSYYFHRTVNVVPREIKARTRLILGS